jgi:hypothetical protein
MNDAPDQLKRRLREERAALAVRGISKLEVMSVPRMTGGPGAE